MYLIPRFGEAYLQNIQPIDIQEFYNDMQVKYRSSTLQKVKSCLNAIYETAIDNELCYKNPAKNIKYKIVNESERKETYSESETAMILAFSDTHKYGLYIRILLELGLRCSELLGLMWSDIDYENKSVSIQRACTKMNYRPFVDTPKSRTSRRVLPLSTDLLTQFEKRKDGGDQDFIVNYKGKPLTPDSFSLNRYRTFFKDLQKDYPAIKKLSPHELRHTCGTLLYARTKDIFAVSKYLGHSDVNITTKLYVHENADILRDHLGIK